MRKINLAFQELLKFCMIFLLSFVWIRYFLRRKLVLAFVVTALVSIGVYCLLFFLARKKQKKYGLKLKEKTDAENMFLSLSCSDKPMDFFAKLAAKKHKDITRHKNHLVIKHQCHSDSTQSQIDTKKHENTKNATASAKSKQTASVKTVLYVDLSFEGLTIPRFMEIYSKIKKEKATKIVICCKQIADKQLSAFCQNFAEKFLILDEYQTYQKLYKFYDCFPEITKKYSTAKKLAFKDFVAYSFNKKRTKGYFFSAFILIISGIFIRATIYYCIVASLLVMFALISQFNPYFNTKGEAEVL